jgi:hypothetical protein
VPKVSIAAKPKKEADEWNQPAIGMGAAFRVAVLGWSFP